MTHFLYVKSFLLVHIINNKKKVEIRELNTFTQKIKIGDNINFNGKVEKGVKSVHPYNNLSAALSAWNPELICPGYTRQTIQSVLEKIYFGKIVVFELE